MQRKYMKCTCGKHPCKGCGHCINGLLCVLKELKTNTQWPNAKKELPKEDGRYLVMLTFDEPVIVNDSIGRRDIPSISNFRIDKGFLASLPHYEITHWMEIPPLSKD